MPRPVTLFSGQWADLSFDEFCRKAKEFGYDGVEIACWGKHLDVMKALDGDSHCNEIKRTLEKHTLQLFAISNHLVGQAMLDDIPALGRPKAKRWEKILPPYVYGDGDPAGVNMRAVEEMKCTAQVARKLNVGIVNGFIGSPIWDCVYDFPPTPPEIIEAGFALAAERLAPFLAELRRLGVKFALESSSNRTGFRSVLRPAVVDGSR